MPVDPASLVALSGLSARDLPDDAELIAETSPATSVPSLAETPVDVAMPFWLEPPSEPVPVDPAPHPSADVCEPVVATTARHEPEHLTNAGIGLVAASPEAVPPEAGPAGRPALPSLAALSLASRSFAARHLPAAPLAPLASLRAGSFDLASLHPSSWRMPDLGTFPTLDAHARRRLALLAGSSVAAGLAAGLAVPVAAEAAPASTAGTVPTGTTPSPAVTEAQLLAAPSPFADLGSGAGSSATSGSRAAQPVAAATAGNAKPAPVTPAPATPAPAKPRASTASVTPAAPATSTPATATPAGAGSTTGGTATVPASEPAAVTPAAGSTGAPGSADPAALLATLLTPATSPFSAVPTTAPAPPAPTGPPTGTAPGSGAPVATATPPSASAAATLPASALPGRSTAAAVVVLADPPAPHPGRPAPATVAPAPVTPVWKVTRPLPARSGTGRRIVYAERAAHLWIVGADGTVLRDYKVTGRADRPKPGTYKVFSKSAKTSNPQEKLTFDLMVRFTRGVTGAAIGFHTIPKTYSGHPIQSEKDLGRAIGMGGCVRQARVDAEWLYAWSRVGDTVVVLH